jgi:hypothetical protein
MFFAFLKNPSHQESTTGEAMPTTMPGLRDPDAITRQVAAEVRNRHRSHHRELRIERVEGGVVLHGRATSYYGKQVAFHEVSSRCRLVVVANRIEVVAHPAPATVG